MSSTEKERELVQTIVKLAENEQALVQIIVKLVREREDSQDIDAANTRAHLRDILAAIERCAQGLDHENWAHPALRATQELRFTMESHRVARDALHVLLLAAGTIAQGLEPGSAVDADHPVLRHVRALRRERDEFAERLERLAKAGVI